MRGPSSLSHEGINGEVPLDNPADDDKFGPVEAFDLAPEPAIAGRIGRIGAFRDDALDIIVQAFS